MRMEKSKMAKLTNCRQAGKVRKEPFVSFYLFILLKIRCRPSPQQVPFGERRRWAKRCCCPLMTAHEQSEDKIPAQKVQAESRDSCGKWRLKFLFEQDAVVGISGKKRDPETCEKNNNNKK